MELLAVIAFFAITSYVLGRTIGNARANSWAGPQTPAMRSRAAMPRPPRGRGRGRAVMRSGRSAGRSLGAVAVHPTNRLVRAQAKADAHRVWQDAFATDWLEQQRHNRANGTTATDGSQQAPARRFTSPDGRRRFVPGHEAVPQGAVRGPVTKVLSATGAWKLLPGKAQSALCGCKVCRSKGVSDEEWERLVAENFGPDGNGQPAQGGTGPAPTGGGTVTAARRPLRQRIRFWTESPDSDDFGKTWPEWKASKDARNSQNGNGPGPQPRASTTAPTAGASGGPPQPPPAQPTSSNGGTPVAGAGTGPSYKNGDFGWNRSDRGEWNTGTMAGAGTSTASAEKAIEGVNEIYAHAVSGGIHAKQEGLKAIHELAVRAAGMVVTLARQMSEPGSNYGPEITEPLATAGTHFQAGATAVSESDAAISTLIHMTVGDLAASARQAPHHSELSESGSR